VILMVASHTTTTMTNLGGPDVAYTDLWGQHKQHLHCDESIRQCMVSAWLSGCYCGPSEPVQFVVIIGFAQYMQFSYGPPCLLPPSTEKCKGIKFKRVVSYTKLNKVIQEGDNETSLFCWLCHVHKQGAIPNSTLN